MKSCWKWGRKPWIRYITAVLVNFLYLIKIIIKYNEKLVKQGWFYLSTDFVETWDKELKKMNKRKNGRPYRYPETFIQFCGLAYAFLHLPYRQLEGFLQALSGFVPGLRSADYTTLWQNLEFGIRHPNT